MRRSLKTLWYGPFPDEADGGAVVNYYLLKMMNYLEPRNPLYAVPKNPSELSGDALPFINYYSFSGGPKKAFKFIPELMFGEEIPLLSMFHLPSPYLPLVNFVRDIGAKSLIHQTIHWRHDDVFKAKVLQDVDQWVAPTRWAKKILAEVGRISSKKIKYIPHSVDTEKYFPHMTPFRKELNLGKEQKVILFVGRCSFFKGIQQLIPIIRPLIREYNAVFIIKAGFFEGNPESKALAKVFSTLHNQYSGNRNLIFIPEWLPPDLIEELFASADILVSPSGHEGFNVPLAEAMACGVPVAATDIPNHAEILGESGTNGILMMPSIDVGEVNDGKDIVRVPHSDLIYGTLKYMLENPDECEEMGKSGLRRARRHYDLAKAANAWWDLLYKVIPEVYSMDEVRRRRLLNIPPRGLILEENLGGKN